MKIFKTASFETPLGKVAALANQDALYLLEFADVGELETEIKKLQSERSVKVEEGFTDPLHSIQEELTLYFQGKLTKFKTPLFFRGTAFQRGVWEQLQRIPYGTTSSYLDIARLIGKETAYRAVAQANAVNRLMLVVPCHRVINANGAIGGFGSGIHRKQWLLDHEQKYQR